MAEIFNYQHVTLPGERSDEERTTLRKTGDEIRRRNNRKMLASILAVTVTAAGIGLRIDRPVGNFFEEANKPADKLGGDISTSFPPVDKQLTVRDGANIRYNPAVADSVEGGRNKCDTLGDNLELDVPTYSAQGGPDGPWTGISTDSLPEDIRNACDKDKDGVVWVADSNIAH